MSYDVLRQHCSESEELVEEILERWRHGLESRGMEVSRTKTGYMSVNDRVMHVTAKLSIPAIETCYNGLEKVEQTKRQVAELEMES